MKKILWVSFLIMSFFAAAAMAQDNIENKKIEFLIFSVQNLKGAKFIRNGTEYDGMEAAKHLRLKRDKAGNHVRTADDFIRLCASKSFTTGKSYMIKFPGGKTVPSEKFLRDKLKDYNSIKTK